MEFIDLAAERFVAGYLPQHTTEKNAHKELQI